MPDQNTEAGNKSEGSGAGSMTLEQATALLSELAPQVAKLTEAFAKLSAPAEPAGDNGAAAVAGQSASEPAAMPDGKKEEGGEGTPAGAGMDERAFVSRIAKRDALADKISRHVGTFDHKGMTLDDVVAYGCEKLGIKAEKSMQAAVLDGYLQAKPAAIPSATVPGMDSSGGNGKGNFVTKHLKGE